MGIVPSVQSSVPSLAQNLKVQAQTVRMCVKSPDKDTLVIVMAQAALYVT